jgi:multiple sugar transport system permease protein
MTVRHGIFLTGTSVLCAWTLVPLYFIALGAVGGREAVNSWPKAFWPTRSRSPRCTNFSTSPVCGPRC